MGKTIEFFVVRLRFVVNCTPIVRKIGCFLVVFGENFEKNCVVVRRCCAVHTKGAKKWKVTQNQKKVVKVFIKI